MGKFAGTVLSCHLSFDLMIPDPAHLLSDLTDPQRQAASHVDGPALILAGPGSGKTRVITRRVAWLLVNGIPA